MKNLVLFLALLGALVSVVTCQCRAQFSTKRMVCYFANWSSYRPAPAGMTPEDLDPCICTHVLYSFVAMSNNALNPSSQDIDYFRRMSAWKSRNPNIKIIISVGGWNEGSGNFNSISSSESTRLTFAQSVIRICRQYNLDGIDIDWEYPQLSQKASYAAFIQKCHESFVAESSSSGKSKLLLTAATAPDAGRMAAYDLVVLAKYFDFINPMTYDMHGSWDGNSAHHTPLLGHDGAATTLQNYINAGFPASKLNMGLAAYGRTQSASGQYTKEGGILAYYEICNAKSNYVFDENIKAPSATVNGQKCYYDDQRSISEKVSWALSHGIGGAFIWDASLDDFSGSFCNQGKSPLISTAIDKLNGGSGSIVTEGPTSSTATTKSTTTTKCAYNGGEFCKDGEEGIYEYPYDCSKYVICNECGEFIQSCPPGTLFNGMILSCDSSSNTECTTKPTPTKPASLCDGSSDIIAHPNDCSKYVLCDGETETIESCPEGEYYNPNLGSCDSPVNVDCPSATTTTTTTTKPTTTTTKPTTTTTTTKPTTTTTKPTTTTTTTKPTTTTTRPTTTTTTRPTTTTTTHAPFLYCDGTSDILPFPNDCSKYVLCEDNSEVVESCPEGEYYNPNLGSCDSPVNVDCPSATTTTTTTKPTTTTTKPTTTTTRPTTTTTTRPTTTTTTHAPFLYCDGTSIILPFPGDCKKYVLCSEESETIETCSDDQLFNEEIGFCDSENFVKCRETITQATETTETITENTTEATQPDYCAGQSGSIRLPDDCSKYVECDNDPSKVIRCELGKLYDRDAEECKYQHDITDCPSPPKIVPICVPGNKKQNEEDCSSYFECGDDKTYYKKSCPIGLNFNEPSQICDFPEKSKCQYAS